MISSDISIEITCLHLFSFFALNVFIIFFFFFNFIGGIDIIVSLLVAHVWICTGLTSNRLLPTPCTPVYSWQPITSIHIKLQKGFTMGNPWIFWMYHDVSHVDAHVPSLNFLGARFLELICMALAQLALATPHLQIHRGPTIKLVLAKVF